MQGNAISDDFCDSQASAFGERNRYAEVGGWSSTKRALAGQWVMVMSITHDAYANMLWLDSLYPVDAAGRPGALRGPCPANRGYPAQTLVENPQVGGSLNGWRRVLTRAGQGDVFGHPVRADRDDGVMATVMYWGSGYRYLLEYGSWWWRGRVSLVLCWCFKHAVATFILVIQWLTCRLVIYDLAASLGPYSRTLLEFIQ